jgi:ankyrin repeat protein
MNKSLRKVIIITIATIVLIGGIILTFTITSNFQSVKASKQLTVAIENNDLQEVQNIVGQYPKSVNTLPSMSPRWWQVLSEQPHYFYPLQKACTWGNYDIIKFLVENGADCNLAWKGIESSSTPLMNAVCSGSERKMDIVKILIEHGADKSIKDEGGKTAYDYAIENGYDELAELLKP